MAKLREYKTDSNMLLFKCEMGAGELCIDRQTDSHKGYEHHMTAVHCAWAAYLVSHAVLHDLHV